MALKDFDAMRRVELHTDWMTQEQAALELGVSVDRISDWVHQVKNPLPMRVPPDGRQGRISRKELDEWITRNWPMKAYVS